MSERSIKAKPAPMRGDGYNRVRLICPPELVERFSEWCRANGTTMSREFRELAEKKAGKR